MARPSAGEVPGRVQRVVVRIVAVHRTIIRRRHAIRLHGTLQMTFDGGQTCVPVTL
jgi:hypothetical protein